MHIIDTEYKGNALFQMSGMRFKIQISDEEICQVKHTTIVYLNCQ